MLKGKIDMIVDALQQGTGAAIGGRVKYENLRSGIEIWFADLDAKHGPVASLRPYGFRGYQIELIFGKFSGQVIDQIRKASAEDVQLARALIESISKDAGVRIEGQNLTDWAVTDGSFRMFAIIRAIFQSQDDELLMATCNEVIVPMMAAMAELIGYDVISETAAGTVLAPEGAIFQAVVNRRERNPRNRLLCIRIHGEKCVVCGIEPKVQYRNAGSIIEVHHLEPLALADAPRIYDPKTDLVPLCPNCHRAIHTKRPIPFTPNEVKAMMDYQID